MPKHPLPGEMISVKAVKRRRDVYSAIHERGVESDRERKVLERNVAQGEGERQRIESAGRQSRQSRGKNEETVIMNKRQKNTEHRKDRRSRQQNSSRPD